MTTDTHDQPELFDFHAALAAGTLGDDELGLATLVVDAFVKTVKAFRYYTTEHPQLQTFRRELFAAMSHYLGQFPVLAVEITESAFLVHGRAVYTAPDLHTSIPFLFFRDGVRQLRWYEGIAEQEVVDLITVILSTDHANQLEDDLVTLMWEQEFAHIDFQAVDYLPEGLPVIVPETVEAFRAQLHTTPQFHRDEMSLWETLTPGAEAVSTQALLTDSDLYRLTTAEMEALQEEVHTVTAPAHLRDYSDLLLDMLALEQDAELFRGLLQALRELLESQLAAEDFRRAGALLARVRDTTAFFTPRAWQQPLLRALPESLVNAHWFTRLEGYLRENSTWAEVLPVLAALPPAAAPQVVRLLGTVESPRIRMALRDVLVTMCADRPDLLLPFLGDSSDQLALDVAKVLGRLGQESCLPALARAFAARGALVRKEIVETVGQIAGAGADQFLIKALHDGDMSVRCQAVATLGRRRTAAAGEALVQAITHRRFGRKPLPEAAALLEAVGRSGAPAAVEPLQHLLFATPWLGRQRANDLRPHVAQALAALNTPEAQTILAHGLAAANVSIATACQKARAVKR